MTVNATEISFFDQIYDAVSRVPAGRVSTYGAIARQVTGRTSAARTVGWALHGLTPEQARVVPWWRIINSQGRISTSNAEHSAGEQRSRLEEEGVAFGADSRVDLGRFGWEI